MKKILIVEDDSQFLDLLKRRFSDGVDFDIESAQDVQEGLQKVQSFVPQLVILDLVLQKNRGEELLKFMRNDQKLAQVPVIISTAVGDTATKIKLMNLGATDFLAKPYDFSELMRLIKLYL